MPLFEYICRSCSRRFETLVMGKASPACPGCGSDDLEKQFSTFAVGGGGQASAGSPESFEDAGSCGTCGDPRGPGSCAIN
jgi:putative FmdB family regulatory protein